MPLVLEREEEEASSPIIVHGDITFVYIKNNNLYRIFFVSLHLCMEGCSKSIYYFLVKICSFISFTQQFVQSILNYFTVVATTKTNANVALIFVFLHRLVQVSFWSYSIIIIRPLGRFSPPDNLPKFVPFCEKGSENQPGGKGDLKKWRLNEVVRVIKLSRFRFLQLNKNRLQNDFKVLFSKPLGKTFHLLWSAASWNG